MEVMGIYTSMIAARKAREVLAAIKLATYEPVSDAYELTDDEGRKQRLILRKIEGRFRYQVMLES